MHIAFLVVDMIPYFWGVCQEKLFNIIYTVFSFSVAFSGRFFKGLSKSYLKRIYFCTRLQKRSQNSNFDLPFTRCSLSFCASNALVLLNIFWSFAVYFGVVNIFYSHFTMPFLTIFFEGKKIVQTAQNCQRIFYTSDIKFFLIF